MLSSFHFFCRRFPLASLIEGFLSFSHLLRSDWLVFLFTVLLPFLMYRPPYYSFLFCRSPTHSFLTPLGGFFFSSLALFPPSFRTRFSAVRFSLPPWPQLALSFFWLGVIFAPLSSPAPKIVVGILFTSFSCCFF